MLLVIPPVLTHELKQLYNLIVLSSLLGILFLTLVFYIMLELISF